MSEIWKTRSCEVLLDRPPWFEVSVEEVELPGGKIVSDYHQIRMPHYTAVFAVTREKMIMVMKCYRHAVGEVTLTMPGGMLEEQEDPMAGIKRELLEETGYEATRWREWITVASSAGLTDECVTLFFASGLKRIAPGGGDSQEEITVHEISLPDVPQWIETNLNAGKLVDGRVYAALYYLHFLR